jgi:hypothetical protein
VANESPDTWLEAGRSVRGVRSWAIAAAAIAYHLLSFRWLRAPKWKNKTEAADQLRALVAEHSGQPHEFWARHVGHVKRVEFTSPGGIWYQATIEPVWDDKPGGTLRVLIALDDGGVGAYHPLTESLLIESAAVKHE